MYDTTKVCLCCVQQIYFDISGLYGESITNYQSIPFSLSVFLDLFSFL